MNVRTVIIILLTACLSGCTTLQKTIKSHQMRNAQQENLTQALKHIDRGNTEKAMAHLKAIVAAPGVAGVTDEALFRLGLLSIPSDLDREELADALTYLERLQKEYPISIWSTQASSLTDFLSEIPHSIRATTELRRQIRTLKDLNLSLTRENKEMKLNIEKLKTLDFELERKAKP